MKFKGGLLFLVPVDRLTTSQAFERLSTQQLNLPNKMSAEEQVTTPTPAVDAKKEDSFSEATLTKVSLHLFHLFLLLPF